MLERKTLVPFLMAGDPSLDVTEELATTLIEEGAETLEIGLPFSDALADGPVIQRAAERALANGTNLENVARMISRLKRKHVGVHFVLFTYLNPLERYGLARYVQLAKECGIGATLTVDLPPEEATEYLALHAGAGVKTVFLTSPTTSRERLSLIAKSSTGFVYVVSRLGVTGTHAAFGEAIDENVARLRAVTDKPIAVGFGISNAEQAARVAGLADGIVVGSAFVKLTEEFSDRERLVSEVRALARVLTKGIRST